MNENKIKSKTKKKREKLFATQNLKKKFLFCLPQHFVEQHFSMIDKTELN